MKEDKAEYVLDKAEVDFIDVRLEDYNVTSITVVDGIVNNCLTYFKEGVAIRVIVDGAWGFQSTTDLTKEGLDSAINRANKMARAEATKAKEKVELK